MHTRTLMRMLLVTAALFGAARLDASPEDLPPLNDPPVANRVSGKFIWMDLFTPDPTAAAQFYEAMFGWEPTRLARNGSSYVLLKKDGRAIGGIVEHSPRDPDAPRAYWLGYVAVSDLAQTLRLVASFGGRVIAPSRAFPRRGVQAIVADNHGAALGLLSSTSGDPEDYQAEPGDWIWQELFVNEPASSATFYCDVFGYEVNATPDDKRDGRFILTANGFARAGIAALRSYERAHSTWLGFVRVQDASAAATRATAHGGRVLVQPRVSEFGTPFSVVADPGGAAIALIEFKPSEPAAAPP